MTRTVALDKNSGSKKFRDACNQEDIVRCILLPRDIRDADDPDVLEFGIANGYMLLTFDKPLYSQCFHLLAGRNPGLLLIREDDESVRQMNSKVAPKFLSKFKKEFPDWCLVPWVNSYVELTPTLIYVYHTWLKSPVLLDRLDRNPQSGWQAKLKGILESNSRSLAVVPSESLLSHESTESPAG